MNSTVKKIWLGLGIFFGSLFLYVFSVSFNLLGLFGEMPSLEILENPKSELASELFSSDGEILGTFHRENRIPVEFKNISINMVNALVATEDARFYEHSGIDLKGTFAIFVYLIKGDSRGSSTLSQQLAKNLFRTRSEKYEGYLSNIPVVKTIIIKTKEWITAIKLERAYSKNEIMTMYLNVVDFGSNAYGIHTAAKTFFNTTPDSLTITQAAVLVGVLKAPSLYSPVLNPDKSLNRRNTVIGQMVKYKFLSADSAEILKKTPITLNYVVQNQNQGIATYFRTIVNNFMTSWCRERGIDLYSDGLKIYTTIDSRLQRYAEEALSEHMTYIQKQFYTHWKGRKPWVDRNNKEIKGFIEKAMKRTDAYRSAKASFGDDTVAIAAALTLKKKMKVYTINGPRDTMFSSFDSLTHYKWFLHAGLMSMDPETGHIKAWVGGIDHRFFKFDHVKQGKRQPGSSFKPFVYTAAIDNGFSPCYQVQDAPVPFYIEDANTSWSPENSDGPPSNEMLTLRTAMARSVNTVAAYLMKRLGPQTVIDYATKMGIKGPLDAVPALCLGISDVSLFEMVGAYCTFPNKGMHTEPFFITRIEDKNGNVLQEFFPKSTEVLHEETAYTMCHMLKGSTTEKGGTALGLRKYPNLWGINEIGGKTGTTQNYSDGWFMGITQNLVSGVWVGGDDRSIHFRDWTYGQGARLALPIWGLYMNKVYGDPKSGIVKGPFKKPASYNVELNCDLYRNPKEDSASGGSNIYIKNKEKEEF